MFKLPFITPNTNSIIADCEKTLEDSFREGDHQREQNRMFRRHVADCLFQSGYPFRNAFMDSFNPRDFSRVFADIESNPAFRTHLLNGRYYQSTMEALQCIDYEPIDWALKLLEDVYTFYAMIKRDPQSFYSAPFSCEATNIFVRLRCGHSWILHTFVGCTDLLYSFTCFQADEEESFFKSSFQDLIDNYDLVKNSAVFKKFAKILSGLLCVCAADTSDSEHIKTLAAAINKLIDAGSLFSGIDLIRDIIDLIILIYTRGLQCMKSGNFHPFFHSEDTYHQWFEDYRLIKKQSHLLNDPEAHGFTESEFFSTLERLIEEGKNMAKFSKVGKYEKRILLSNVDELTMIQCTFLSSQKARESRDAPFSVLINGASSVGKSSIVELLFNYFASLKDLPNDDIYKYTKNPVSKFWDGFKSYMWCLLIDDIAFQHPNKAQNGDLSVMEVIQICNNIPYVVDQAALEDKGKTPLRCKLVIATTNQKDLNASHYFNYPVAVRRRLPIVITVVPKKEYRTPSGFLDTSKLPEESIPDYWIWSVEKVAAVQDKGTAKTVYKQVLETDSVHEFLQFFGKEAMAFENIQKLAKESCNRMKTMTACKNCYSVCCNCELSYQSEEIIPLYTDIIYYLWSFLLYYLIGPFSVFMYSYFDNCFTLALIYYVRLAGYSTINSEILLYRRVGKKTMLEMIGKHKFKIAIAVPLGLLALYKLYKYFKKQPTVATETELQNEDEVAPTPAEIDDILNKVSMQLPEPGEAKSFGLTLGTKPVPMEKERNNVWFDKSFEITPMELRHGVSSVKSMDINQFANLIAKNIFKVEIFSDAWSGKTHLLGIVGQVFLVNTHAYVKCSDSIVLRAQVGVSNTGIKNIVTLNLHKTQFRLLSGDISFIVLGAMPACKDITKYFSDTALEGKHKGFYIFPFLKNKVQAVKYIEYNPLTYFTALEINSDAYESTVHTPTVIGSCGCPLVISNGHGYIVAGFHFSGNATKAYSIPLAYNMFKPILKDIHVMYQYEPGVIKLKYPSKEHTLTTLHNKSPFRYIEEGIANVYGSFVGFRPSRKSRVGPTYCQDWFVKHGYKVNMYAPDIKSWKPWYIAADAYCKNQHRWNDLLIAGCAESFKIDILSKIDSKQLADVKPLDIETAVNGAPGVAYIDPMPRGTSTGFPYKTTKAKYLTLREDKTVEVHQEILDTIEEIKQCYLRKEKYNVIFCANLKDEPVSASKKESGKARVFAGSPFAWSILCRQYLLPVVRLIQNNKFIFEAGPGTITQSNEWGAIFKYLTKSGKYTKFVNGDYKNYDKGMYGEFIRYAGFICSEICREAGYSEEDLLIVNGLFADMVKALMDFNGDLVQFLGSMPSGIPLTVIVNCIVNSLYMRYVFVVIMTMPPSEFQKYVRLYTYGDDNVLGVSDDLMGKYNHTSIAKVFGVYNLTYTMANKDEESRPFVTAEEISFLKRTWKFDFDMQTYLAPLDHDSINKMLTVCVHSKSVPLEAQTVSAMSSALSEYFFYGKKTFLEKRELMLKCIEENDLHCWTSKSSFPTYQELVERFNSQGTIEDFYSSAVCRD